MPAFQPIGTTPEAESIRRVTAPDARLTRTHFFDGRLLTAHDLTRDQVYLDQRLRDLGRAGGDGVATGLELAFDAERGALEIGAGLGVSPSGRVVGLESALAVDLGDRALMQQLNGSSHLDAGAYAVVLLHAEFPSTTVAEVFPTDLGAERGASPDAIEEGAEVVLVKLPVPLPPGPRHAARAALAREILDAVPSLPAEGVALGVLAIEGDAPRWVDARLLRHPLRRPGHPAEREDDLRRHYEDLLGDVRTHRQNTGRTGAFAAGEYFHRLPAFGPAPKESFDPAAGTFEFFPREFDITISIVQARELDAIAGESRLLDPLDPTGAAPASVLVLARLGADDFAKFAPLLEKDGGDALEVLPFIDPLRLRWRRAPEGGLDTDAETWRSIWDALGPDDVFYVRRAPRAAATPPTGILLAHGAGAPGQEEIAALEEKLEKEKLALRRAEVRVGEQQEAIREQAAELARQKSAFESQKAELDRERTRGADLARQAESQKRRIADLERKIAELEAGGAGRDRELERERTKVTRHLAEIEALKVRLKKADGTNARHRTELRDLARTVAAKDAEIQRLRLRRPIR